MIILGLAVLGLAAGRPAWGVFRWRISVPWPGGTVGKLVGEKTVTAWRVPNTRWALVADTKSGARALPTGSGDAAWLTHRLTDRLEPALAPLWVRAPVVVVFRSTTVAVAVLHAKSDCLLTVQHPNPRSMPSNHRAGTGRMPRIYAIGQCDVRHRGMPSA